MDEQHAHEPKYPALLVDAGVPECVNEHSDLKYEDGCKAGEHEYKEQYYTSGGKASGLGGKELIHGFIVAGKRWTRQASARLQARKYPSKS